MLNTEYKILKLIRKNPLTIDEIEKKLKRRKLLEIEDCMDHLEEEDLISELYEKELKNYNKANFNKLSGNMGKPTGKYRIKFRGVYLLEEEYKIRFGSRLTLFFSVTALIVSAFTLIAQICLLL